MLILLRSEQLEGEIQQSCTRIVMLQGCLPCSSMADLQLRSLAAELTSPGKEMHRAPTDDHFRHGPRKLEITGINLGHCRR